MSRLVLRRRSRHRAVAPTAVAIAVAASLLTAGGPAEAGSLPAATTPGAHTWTGSTPAGSYVIKAPAVFNGTLLLYSHGYRFTAGRAVDAPDGTDTQLLARGYALAGSSYSNGGAGWAVAEGVAADEQLISLARARIGSSRVRRVYAWGESLGGLITQTLAERHPQLVSAAAPLCGVLAGTDMNLDLALDAAVMTKALLYPGLKLDHYRSASEAASNLSAATTAILTQVGPGSTQGESAVRVLAISTLLGGPTQTRDFNAMTAASAVSAATETLLTALTFGTVGRYDLEHRTGGNPSTNVRVNYLHRINATTLARWHAYGLDDAMLRAQAMTVQLSGVRVVADPRARLAAARLGDPTGALVRRTLTMHTVFDPLVEVQNESVFAKRVAARHRSALLRQLWVSPPAYADGSPADPTDGAPYGAGHCNFSTAQYLAVVRTLDHWARTGRYSVASVAGLSESFAVPSWPSR